MTSRLQTLIPGLLLALASSHAAAGLKNIENAYEARLADVSLPAGPGGQMTVRECATCKPLALRTGSRTLYVIGDASSPAVGLAALREASLDSARQQSLLTVFYSIESKVVTRIVLSAN